MSVYRQFGVEPIINAAGTVTRLGGAIMPDAVVEAMRQAARDSVSLESLQAAASAVIARVTGTQAGLVTCGASAGLTLGTAAILARNNLARIGQLPDTTLIPHDILVARDQRNGYDHAVRAAGARLVDVGVNERTAGSGVRGIEIWEYEAAITNQTAGILFVVNSDHSLSALERVVALAQEHGFPVLVDAAAELPPKENLERIPATGVDLVVFSGGKAIRGPQSTGILCGRADLIHSAAMQMLDMDEERAVWTPPAGWCRPEDWPDLPRQGIGRGFKVAKEQIVGLLVALELFANGTYERAMDRLRARVEALSDELRNQGIQSMVMNPSSATAPLLELLIGSVEEAIDACRRLRAGSPPIYVAQSQMAEGVLRIDLSCVREEDDAVLGDRLREVLGR